jgi:hypothetical protein
VPLPPEEPPDETEMERVAAIAARVGGEILGHRRISRNAPRQHEEGSGSSKRPRPFFMPLFTEVPRGMEFSDVGMYGILRSSQPGVAGGRTRAYPPRP